MQVSDAMSNPWWSAMYTRNLVKDPTNKNYSNFNQPGLTLPIVVESNPQYSVAMNRHQDGLDAYKMGAVSPAAAAQMGRIHPAALPSNVLGAVALGPNAGRSVGGISGCASRTGDPTGCASLFLNTSSMGQPLTYSRMG